VEDGSHRVDRGTASADGSAAASGVDPELTRLILYADSQERKVRELQTTVSQLQAALDSRVVIERAVGMLAERLNLVSKDAFELLRSAARTSRREVRALAEQITESRAATPAEVVDAFARYETL
jgi:AmiR/NasT family two-component response regulator